MSRPKRSRNCLSGKARFESERDAEVFLAEHRKTKATHAPRMSAYRCLLCPAWHVTSYARRRSGGRKKWVY